MFQALSVGHTTHLRGWVVEFMLFKKFVGPKRQRSLEWAIIEGVLWPSKTQA